MSSPETAGKVKDFKDNAKLETPGTPVNLLFNMHSPSSITTDPKVPIGESSIPNDDCKCIVNSGENTTVNATSIIPRHIRMPPKPPSEWRFDKLLVDLSKLITSADELDTLKDRFRSQFKCTIEEITKPRDLFKQMERKGKLNANEVIYLQTILLTLDRKDVVKKVIDYSLENHVLHFEPSEFDPVSGYENAYFHVTIDDPEYDREKITALRTRVADILCVDICLVSVTNVKPSHSLLVTIMLPNMLVEIMAEYLANGRIQDRFAVIGIDRITIRNRVFNIEVSNKPPKANRSGEMIDDLHQQVSDREHELESMRGECTAQKQEIDDLRNQLNAKAAHYQQLEAKQKTFEEEEIKGTRKKETPKPKYFADVRTLAATFEVQKGVDNLLTSNMNGKHPNVPKSDIRWLKTNGYTRVVQK